MTELEQEQFIIYWQKVREKSKWNPFLFVRGFFIAFSLGLIVVLSITVGWYQRATMVANAKLNIWVLLFAILIIAFFCAILYNNFKWEQLEQQYKELLASKKSTKKN